MTDRHVDADDQAWTDRFGPVYRQSDVADLLGKSKQAVVAALTPVVATPWTIASWLTSPQPTLGGHTPLGRLRAGDVDEVLKAAHHMARVSGGSHH